ncbi:helix-turn-helix domain-containing protein [Streptodolium elevatio]
MDARTAIERRHAAWRVDPVEALDPEAQRQRAEMAAAIALAKAVHDARVAAGLSEAELADRAGLDEDAVVCIEESGTTPTPDLLNRLARALDSDVTLTWTGEGVRAAFAPHAA